MAYFVDPNQQPKQKNQGQDPNAAPMPAAPAAAATPAQPPAPAAASGAFNPQASQAKAPNSSGQFLSYDRLLNANRAAGTSEANTLTQNAQNTAAGASRALGAANTTFNNAVNAGADSASASVPAAPPVAGAPPAGGYNPFSQTQMDDLNNQLRQMPGYYQPRIDALQQQIGNTQYTGPTAPGNYFDDAQTQALKATQQLQALGSTAGRQGQLGGSLFDAMLTGSLGGGQLNKAAAGATAPVGALNTALGNAQSNVSGAQGAVANMQNSLQGQLQQTQGQQTQATADAQAAQQTQQKNALQDQQYQSFQKSKPWTVFSAPGLTDMTAQEFGSLTPDQQAFLASGGAYVNGGQNMFNGNGNSQVQQILSTVTSSRSKK